MAEPLAVQFHPQESDAGCVLACAQMALGYLGISQAQSELARVLDADPDLGTISSRLTRLDSSELEVIYTEGELDTVEDLLGQGHPVVLFVQTSELAYWKGHQTQHAVVVIGMDESTATVFDPAFPETDNPQHVQRLELQLASDWMHNRYAVIRRR